MQVQDPVTLATQVPAVVAQDEGLGLSVVMVITQRLGGGAGEECRGHSEVFGASFLWVYLCLGLAVLTQPLAGREGLSMLLVYHTQGGQTQPQLGGEGGGGERGREGREGGEGKDSGKR